MDQRDIDAVVAAGHELRSLGDVASLRQAVPEIMGRLVPGTRAGWNDVDLVRGENLVVLTEPLPLWPGAGADLVRHLPEHPLYAHFQRTGDGRPHAISELVTPGEFHRTALYNEIYHPLGIEDQMGANVPDPERHVQLTVDRGRWGFSRRDLAVLALLHSSVVARYDLLLRQARLDRLLAMREAMVAPDLEGLVVVRSPDRIEDATPAATEILERWFGRVGDTLPPALAHWYAVPRGRRAGARPPLRMECDGRTLVVRRAELADEVLVLRERVVGQPGRLRRSWGLTGRQVDVVGFVATGATNAQIAAELGISRRTVEKHLQQAYEQLGVTSRTAAAAVVRELEGWPAGPPPAQGNGAPSAVR